MHSLASFARMRREKRLQFSRISLALLSRFGVRELCSREKQDTQDTQGLSRGQGPQTTFTHSSAQCVYVLAQFKLYLFFLSFI